MQRVCRLIDNDIIYIVYGDSVCAINTGNDIMGHSPTIFCLCKISDGWKLSEEYIVYFALLIGQCTQQLSARRYHKNNYV